MAEKAGFKIGEQVYEFPTRFRLGDPILVEAVTGIDFETFSERLDRMNERRAAGEDPNDAVVLAGLVAVAVWQANPSWKRDRVAAYVVQVDFETFEAVGGDDDGPPAVGVASPEIPSTDSSVESTITRSLAEPELV